ncbi:hypothetical protein C8R21_12043 [Nitrosospira multiformis]|uniref:Uncharacterized protein n=1 Tax=Nitrosospira multiformis TaxID=1231 RepID=A0A2T5I848_9PROT|nr:hypothetical protein C8R21_12043 [Nitrosospira multiformis]
MTISLQPACPSKGACVPNRVRNRYRDGTVNGLTSRAALLENEAVCQIFYNEFTAKLGLRTELSMLSHHTKLIRQKSALLSL